MCPFLRLLKNSFFGKKWHIFWKLKFSLLCDSCIVVNLVWEAEHKSLRSKSDFHLICVVHPPYVLAQLLRVRPCRATINNQQSTCCWKKTRLGSIPSSSHWTISENIQRWELNSFLRHYICQASLILSPNIKRGNEISATSNIPEKYLPANSYLITLNFAVVLLIFQVLCQSSTSHPPPCSFSWRYLNFPFCW